MQCFRCSRTQLDRSQAPHGVTEEQAQAIGWRKVLEGDPTTPELLTTRGEQEWLCPFCCGSVKVIDLCGQSLCMNEAAYSFLWPGQRRSFICHAHHANLLEIAGALGLSTESLDLQPVDRNLPMPNERDARKRYRVGPPAVGIPMWAVLDDELHAAIAMCWHEEEAKRIVHVLNEHYGVNTLIPR